MARGKKRSRSLFELMDPHKDYRASIGPGWTRPESAGSREEEEQQKPAEIEVQAQAEVQMKKPGKAKVAEKVAEPESEQTYGAEPLFSAEEGKIRITLNYPLAGLICFVLAVVFVCGILIGWRFGRDGAFRMMKESVNGPGHTENVVPGRERP